MSILQPPILSTSVVKTEPPTVIKNEPPEPEIMNIDFDEDIKNIDIVSHPLSEDFIKSQTVPENIIKCEKTEDTDDGNETWDTGQEAVKVQGIRTKHPKKTDCARCPKKTLESNLWKKEKEKIKVIKAPKIQYSCDRCDFKTRYSTNLKVHNIIHLKPEERQYFYCDHCSFKSRRKSYVRQHIFTLHNKNVERFSCDRCDFKTRYYTSLKRHNLIHLKPEERQYFYCDHCSFKSRRKSYVREHIFTLHNKNVERFRCDHCDYITYRPDHLKSHNIIHLKPEETQYFYCDHCSFKSRHKSCVKKHIFKLHNKNVERFRCDHCDYKTYRPDRLKRHNIIHLNSEEVQYFYCSHCSYKSNRKSNLRIHIFRHFQNEEVKFYCYICDFMTLERELIIYHIRKHSKVRKKSKINEGN